MKIDLTGPTAVVTGASRGIGLAGTRARTASGVRVIAGTLHSSAESGKLTVEGAVATLKADLAAPGGPAVRTRSPTWYCWPGTAYLKTPARAAASAAAAPRSASCPVTGTRVTSSS